MAKKHVIIVGGGFAGLSCAQRLVDQPEIQITLIDKNNYHEFTPLLYQVATSSLAPSSAATPFRQTFAGKANIDIKMAHVNSVDPHTLTVKTEEGDTYQGDYLVLAAGSVVNFYDIPGAEEYSYPMYNLIDAERLRSRMIRALEDADRNPQRIEQGVLNFVIVGGGTTGTEIAGAISDMIRCASKEFSDMSLKRIKIILINHGFRILNAFSQSSQDYATKVLQERNVEIRLGVRVEAVTDAGVKLSTGETVLSKTVIWAGGLKAPSFADHCGLSQGQAGCIPVLPNLTVEGFPQVYVLGDLALIRGKDGAPLSQLASVAHQSGECAAEDILAAMSRKAPRAFHYDDKGILAMIGKNAAVIEVGEKRQELKGFLAYWTWLSVHLVLLGSFSQKVMTCVDWVIDFFGRTPPFQILDRNDTTRIKWDD